MTGARKEETRQPFDHGNNSIIQYTRFLVLTKHDQG